MIPAIPQTMDWVVELFLLSIFLVIKARTNPIIIKPTVIQSNKSTFHPPLLEVKHPLLEQVKLKTCFPLL